MRRRIATVIVGAVVALAASTSPAAADPPAVQHIRECGQAITSSKVVFDRNLTCDVGFTITFSQEPGAISTATIDLKGHRFRGTGAGTAFTVAGVRGLGVAGLSLTNGRVDHWSVAVRSDTALTNLSDVRVDHNATALNCFLTPCAVSDVQLDHNTVGIAAGARVDVTRTLFSRNQLGATASPPGELHLTSSAFEHNAVGVRASGISHVDVEHSLFFRNGVGILGQNPDGTLTDADVTLTDNTFVRNGDGIYLNLPQPEDSLFPGPRIADNTTFRNTRYGIYAPTAQDLGGNSCFRDGKPAVGAACGKPGT